MLELLLKCTDEKNISLAVRGYKIFFSSTALTLNCKPMAGLNKNRKPVAGLTTKNCQLISGRGKAKLHNEVLEEMLKLSEQLTGIELRKKFGTKQS
ncbi:MAG: hypothetical protein KJZ55_03485 [Flavobacteriales bacterium]|nr:hypothetical protein [Flavobacteriales bacterium]